MTRLLLAALLCLGLVAPAEAAILPGADFEPGTTLGAGAMGLSADHALGSASLGAAIQQSFDSYTLFHGRALVRFVELPSDHAAVMLGARYDPGRPGARRALVPDVGVALAHRFELGGITIAGIPMKGVPVILRGALTLTTADPRYGLPPTTVPTVGGNFFQRLTFGPNTHLGLAIQPSRNVELTVGSGTLLGMRVIF